MSLKGWIIFIAKRKYFNFIYDHVRVMDRDHIPGIGTGRGDTHAIVSQEKINLSPVELQI